MDSFNNTVVCGICLEDMKMRKTLHCGHKFCKTCIDKWCNYKGTCPNCRVNIHHEQNIYSYSTMTDAQIRRFENDERLKYETDLITICIGLVAVPIMAYVCSVLENSI
jgi:hypothetical protein